MWESTGSKSLLDVAAIPRSLLPTNSISPHPAPGKQSETSVDLMETFNWLRIGINVKHIDHQKGFLTVTGVKRGASGRSLIIWRNLSDDPKADNVAIGEISGEVGGEPSGYGV